MGISKGYKRYSKQIIFVSKIQLLGFKPLNLSFKYSSKLDDWVGLGRDASPNPKSFIDDTPMDIDYYSSIGCYEKFAGGIPGPNNPSDRPSRKTIVSSVELYVKNLNGWVKGG